jgi:hypothetical protein
MAPMKMSWRVAGGRLASEWVKSEATESYNPAWMQSPYPREANARRSNPGPSSSPFGKPRYQLETAMMPNRCA